MTLAKPSTNVAIPVYMLKPATDDMVGACSTHAGNKILVRKSVGRDYLRYLPIWEDNIKVGLTESPTGCEDVIWVERVQNNGLLDVEEIFIYLVARKWRSVK
jgi:hypothetical protein